MTFSSLEFFLFLAVYLLIHLALPLRHRIALIVVGSAFFYGCFRPAYLWVPFLLIAIGHWGARAIDRAEEGSARSRRVLLTTLCLLAPLLVFKYTDFIHASLTGSGEKLLGLPLPLGTSFITFTLIAYIVDVHRRDYPVEPSLGRLTAYVLFFPQLVAGPILKPRELLPQLAAPRKALRGRFTYGALVFCLGLVKKVLFADSIAAAIDPVFAQAADAGLQATDYLLAIYGYSMQIYCDFSGYTDMALGLGMILGVRLPRNFRSPYSAASLVEFWRRWHITLSLWLRDYLYIPLGGGRAGLPAGIRNVCITMILGGLWHGASWNFVLWGAMHGALIAAAHVVRHLRRRVSVPEVPRWLGILLTFHAVTILWVFFRAADFTTAITILQGPFVSELGDLAAFAAANAFYLLLLAVFGVFHHLDDHRRMGLLSRWMPSSISWGCMLAIAILTMAISEGSSAEFIYFDF